MPTPPPPALLGGKYVCKGPKDAIKDPARVRMRVICVPQAGMGAWAFHDWQAAMPAEVEVLPVEPPGRNSRMVDPKPTSMSELVADLIPGLNDYGAFDKPYVLVGHSLGAWCASAALALPRAFAHAPLHAYARALPAVGRLEAFQCRPAVLPCLIGRVAFELCAAQMRSGGRLPSLLVVSGCRAPHLSALEHDNDTVQPAISKLAEDDFWTHFERRYGRNPDLAEPFVKQMVTPLLRADFGIVRLARLQEPTHPIKPPDVHAR